MASNARKIIAALSSVQTQILLTRSVIVLCLLRCFVATREMNAGSQYSVSPSSIVKNSVGISNWITPRQYYHQTWNEAGYYGVTPMTKGPTNTWVMEKDHSYIEEACLLILKILALSCICALLLCLLIMICPILYLIIIGFTLLTILLIPLVPLIVVTPLPTTTPTPVILPPFTAIPARKSL